MSELFEELTRRVRVEPRDDEVPLAGVQDDTVVAALAAHQDRRGHARLVALVVVTLVCAGVPGWYFGVRESGVRSRFSNSMTPAAGNSSSDPKVPAPVAPAAAFVAPSPNPAPVHAARAAAVVVSDRPVPSAARDELALAMYFHRSGDFENALLHYRAVLQHNELDAQAHNNLGLLYQEKNLFAESARELQRAIIINPAYTAAYNNYGVTLLRQGRLDEAVAEFQAVLASDPDNVDALVNVALAENSAGQPDRARESLLRALAVAPGSAAAHYNLAVLYDDTDPPRALEHYKAFLQSSRGDFAADQTAVVRARIAALAR